MNKYKGCTPAAFPFYDFRNKEACSNNHIRYMLNRTQALFKYNRLPDTMQQRELELILQINGNAAIADVGGDLYALSGGAGGEPDAYYRPTIYTVANPALKLSKSYKINEDCVVIGNDSMFTGLMPMFRRYAAALTENELSMKLVTINSRQASIINAADDRAFKSAEKYLQDLEDGKQGVIGDSIMERIGVQPYGSANYTNALLTLIEHEQYLKASWFNDMGLNANYNMKREAINSNESQLNEDMLLPLIDDMLNCRKKGLERVNEMFGTDISVELASSWEDNRIELDAMQKALEADAKEKIDQEGDTNVEQIKQDME